VAGNRYVQALDLSPGFGDFNIGDVYVEQKPRFKKSEMYGDLPKFGYFGKCIGAPRRGAI